MLEEVVHPGGTGIKARVPSYRIGGKTGTAWRSKNGNYSKEYISTFVGIAPLNHPRLVVLVKIDKPQGLYYGSDVAAPIFSEVTSAALRLLGVPPDSLPEESIFTYVESKTLNGNGLRVSKK
jgi:cell division protein FtsI (penicillin-binding protein 3)